MDFPVVFCRWKCEEVFRTLEEMNILIQWLIEKGTKVLKKWIIFTEIRKNSHSFRKYCFMWYDPFWSYAAECVDAYFSEIFEIRL